MGGTHLPILLDILGQTTGNVLELGSGWYSTPTLYWYCKKYGRRFDSYETDRSWVKSLEGMATFVDDYDEAPIDDIHWDLVFIDHAPAERRIVDIRRLKDHTDYFVLHDTEPEHALLYRFSEVIPMFEHRYTYKEYRPYTTVLSNKQFKIT